MNHLGHYNYIIFKIYSFHFKYIFLQSCKENHLFVLVYDIRSHILKKNQGIRIAIQGTGCVHATSLNVIKYEILSETSEQLAVKI